MSLLFAFDPTSHSGKLDIPYLRFFQELKLLAPNLTMKILVSINFIIGANYTFFRFL